MDINNKDGSDSLDEFAERICSDVNTEVNRLRMIEKVKIEVTKVLNSQPTLCEVTKVLNSQPTLTEMVSNRTDIELILLQPGWDFMIMRTKKDPTVGIAVSNKSGTCGQGLEFLAVNESSEWGYWTFQCPCACCNWKQTLKFLDAGRSLVSTCESSGITHLVFNCHRDLSYRYLDYPWGINFINPFSDEEINSFGRERYLNLFEGFKLE
jgi:hypothetical protein